MPICEIMEPIYKIHGSNQGYVNHIQEIYNAEMALNTSGIVITDVELISFIFEDLKRAFNTLYIDGLVVKSRPDMQATINSPQIGELCIITGLPQICKMTVDEQTFEVTDGEFGFPVTLSGTYKIKAECFPYKDKEWEVVV